MNNVLVLPSEVAPPDSGRGSAVHGGEIIRERIPNNFSPIMLTLLAVVVMLYWAREFFIPLMFGVMLSYALSPLVSWMQKRKIPRAVGAAVVLIGIVGGIGSLAYTLSDETVEAIELLPEAAQKLRQMLRKEQAGPASAIRKVQNATTELQQVAQAVPAPSPAVPKGVARVQIEKPKFNVQDYVWNGMKETAGFTGRIAIIIFLAYFLIVSGDSFRRKLVRISGPTLAKKKITLQGLDEITDHIQHYLLIQLLTSTVVGIVTWLALVYIGVEHAAVWGIAAGILNMIPYLGALIATVGMTLVGFLQFETIGMALLVGGIVLMITNLESLLVTPWLTSRVCQMNAVAIFVGLLFWGWLWGISGMLLGIPILLAIKATCDRVEDLKPVGELLGK